MRNKVTKQIVFLCCIIIFSLLGNSIALSQSQVSDTSDLEKKIEQKAQELTQAAKNATKKKLEKIEDFLSKGGWDIDNEELKIITVNETVREKITEIQTSIKNLFIATAVEIEKEDEIVITVDDSGIGLSKRQKEKKRRLSESKNQINLSIRSQAMAIQVLLKINDDLIALAEQEEKTKKKQNMYLTQAVYVYELSSIVVDMIDNLSIHGIEDLHNLYKETMDEVSKMEVDFNKMVEEDNDEEAKNWLKALDVLRGQWNMLLSFLDKQEDWIENLKKAKKKFEKITKKAVYQIQLLEMGIVAEKVMEQIEAVKTILEIENIPLLRLGRDEAISLFTVMPSGDLKDTSIKLESQ